ncbi:MAG TPA: 3-deoxy-manno-octulosonate cytidylyltransferase [Acidobacteriaceae bacterium]
MPPVYSQLFSAVESGSVPEPQRVLGVIPARLGSTRLPRKMLRTLAGEPMLAWVYRAARACSQLHQVLIATDAEEVMQLAEQYGFPAIFTPQDCASGTDRVHVVAQSIAADIYVNIQGDEPLLRPAHLDALLAPMLAAHRDGAPRIEVATLATACPAEQVHSPHVVKVVTDARGQALYFSRAAIPFDRDAAGFNGYLKHLGFYAYRKRALDLFPALPASALEAVERLEQLRFLENGIGVHVSRTPYDTRGVDTEEDLSAVEQLLAARTPAPEAG